MPMRFTTMPIKISIDIVSVLYVIAKWGINSMNNVHILDCTLRDGGYCNEWKFGFENIKKIINGLLEANVDIIECGFLTDKIAYDSDITKYSALEELEMIIPKNRNNKIFVVMMNYGEYNIENLPPCDGTSVDGIRVTFHKKNLLESLKLCEAIKEKGYKVFVQAMVSLSYNDSEFLELIQGVNRIQPYLFYIVDSFGMMKKKELIRLFYMVEHNLEPEILIGFHSHNNMQLAYSNAQSLVDVQTRRDLIIDSSIYGMGRGAGNLNTELFVEYLNENLCSDYQLKPLFTIIDEILNDFYQRNYWGYSLPNYLSAAHNAHPSYASYLDDKKTLTVENISEIFDMMDAEKKLEFDKGYIESLYLRYMETGKVQEQRREELEEKLSGKKILLIAPGKSSVEEKQKIINFSCQEGIITISVNFEYQHVDTDWIFMSNLRRFRELSFDKHGKCIVTSNIPADNIYLQTQYRELLNEEEAVKDNAGMMAIKFLSILGAKEIYLAGFDGYSYDEKDNYASTQLSFVTRSAVLDLMNKGMEKVLQRYKKEISVYFLTSPRFLKL